MTPRSGAGYPHWVNPTGHSEGWETRHKQQCDCVVPHCDPEEGGALRRRVDLNPALFGSKTQELALEGEGRGRGTVFTTPMGPGDTDKTVPYEY